MDIIKFVNGVLIASIVVAVVIALGLSAMNAINNKDQFVKEGYQSFKKDTEVIKGTVEKAEKESHFIFPNSYNIVVKNDDNSKMIRVNEDEYRDYQVGSKAHFRIDTTKDNEIVRDLKKENDITTLKEYKKYKNHPRGLFENLTEKR